MKELKKFSQVLLYIGIMTAVFATYGAFWGNDLWLAPTQWLLLTTVLLLFSLHLKTE